LPPQGRSSPPLGEEFLDVAIAQRASPKSPTEHKFARDSLLEGDGFEPSVPLVGKPRSAIASGPFGMTLRSPFRFRKPPSKREAK
jgi:hypothetical protein